ncbi:MAG: UvrB/UvrC motif-containing protein [Gemmatimonadetes bacterium]|nr:UvrB/UvrC motif-containing protein [Gemmatimonadota bacterium]
MNRDIGRLLDEWEYTGPDKLIVRKIKGEDGRTRIQMRVDLGILQMEWSGRPDGGTPHGKASLLDHYLERLEKRKADKGPDAQLNLSHEDCVNLQSESLQYYYRRICMFELESYHEACRDAEHNLQIMDMVRTHAENDDDRLSFEQYRPFVIMHRTRARSLIATGTGDTDKALHHIEEGIEEIETFFRSYDRNDLVEESQELKILRDMAEEIRKQQPRSEEDRLRAELTEAVENEEFERAAEIRDELKKFDLP